MNQQILDYLRRDKAIDDEILEALLCSHGSKRNDAQAIVKKIYKEERIDSISKKEMHILGDTIRYAEKKLILQNRNWFNIFTDSLSYLIFAFILSIFVWMIFHSQSRASIDFGLQPITVIFISVIITFFVALLEGSQIAIVNISDKDISKISDKYPIAYEIQKLTRTKESIQEYLIGRQLLVVALVIIFSLLTSFPNIDSIYENIKIPGIIDLVAFKLGLLNALILLWFGQLIPQLLATKAPLYILNMRIVKYVVHICLYLCRLKIAKPSSLVVNLANIKEHKPEISEYDSFLKNIDLYRHYLDSYTVTINYDHKANVTIESKRKFIFCDVVRRIIRRTLGIYGDIDKFSLSNVEATTSDGAEFRLVDTGSTAEPQQNGDMTFFSHVLEPQTSTFHEGDEIDMVDSFTLSNVEQLDIRIDRPVRVLFIKCTMPDSILEERNVKIPNLSINIALEDAAIEDYHPGKEIQIIPTRKDGFITASYASLFPLLQSNLSVNWDVK